MNAPQLDATLSALADPTRRAVMEMLSREPTSASAIARHFDMSLPAMSRHLRILRRSGLIEDGRVEEDARIRMYRLKRDRLAELGGWISELEKFWSGQLQAFKAYAETTGREVS
ncbi:MAG: metalloregulator ArsR/SmtB family transcription factor [Xanthomonadales bacterium]|nr:metalloregulator ArsR/SmtB family transcription factor [Xanthomonadales bacterium]